MRTFASSIGSKARSTGGWFHSGTILQQLGKAFNLLALAALAVGAIATIGVIRIQDRSEVLAELTDVAFLTSSMNRHVVLAKDEMGAYRARGYEVERIESAFDHANTALEMNHRLAAAATSVDQDFAGQITAIEEGLQGVVTVLEEVRDAPPELINNETFLGPRYDAIDSVTYKIVALRDEAATRVENQSTAGLWEIEVLIGLLCAGIILAMATVYFLRRMIANRIVMPLTAISDVSGRIAHGETELEIPETGRSDEIGILANSLTVLRQVQAEASEQAVRELERERELLRERETQRNQYNDKLRALADQFEASVGEVANQVATSSTRMKSAADDLAKKVEGSSVAVVSANSSLKEASAGITSAASATDEFALSISEVSHQASTSSERARKAASSVTKADETILELTDSAAKISQIVEVIAGIAQRTNLLALNASIEAARSSEHGRGFAVVAAEVKDLAAQTEKATKEVEHLIGAMQHATDQSAQVLSSISEEVRALETTAISIASAVDQQSVAAHDLSKSIDLAAANTKTVSATIDDVSEVSVTSGAIVTQVLESSTNLSEQSETLRRQVGEFLSTVRAA